MPRFYCAAPLVRDTELDLPAGAARHVQVLRLQPGLGPWSLSLVEGRTPDTTPGRPGGPSGQTSGATVLWPAAWLTALGTPWNTLQPSGLLRLSSPGVSLHWAQGRFRLEGSVMLEATDIVKRFGQNEVLRGVSVRARQGDVIAMIGASGSGKSTFLRCLNLLEAPHAGRIPLIIQSLIARPDDSADEHVAVPVDAVRLGADAFATVVASAGTPCSPTNMSGRVAGATDHGFSSR
jgi:ABC-type multidrug transport system fused ATPase/permease subunit